MAGRVVTFRGRPIDLDAHRAQQPTKYEWRCNRADWERLQELLGLLDQYPEGAPERQAVMEDIYSLGFPRVDDPDKDLIYVTRMDVVH